jgi:Na+-transporting NADH:ubiquinone oxidoreductase subunit C
VIFTTLLCVVFSLMVSVVAVVLEERQEENRRLNRIKNVLGVAGLLEPGERISREEMSRRFEERLAPRIVDLQEGRILEGVDAMAFNQRAAASDPSRSREAPENAAKVRRIPNQALIFEMRDGDRVEGLVLPVEGYGLWSTLYGYLALEADGNTIRGITFYEHGETAGLGGEVDNPRWKALWPGRLAFDESGELRIRVKKGAAGPPDRDPHQVDGLSGATLTANGVTHLIHFWLGENGFRRYLDAYRREKELG